MESFNYSMPMQPPYPPEFNGYRPHDVARVMIAHPGTDFSTAVRDFDRLADELEAGRVQSAAAEFGPRVLPETLHLSILERESRQFGLDAQTGEFVTRDGRRGDAVGAEVAAAIDREAQAIWRQIPRTELGGEHLSQALLAEVALEARYRHVRTLEAQQPQPATADLGNTTEHTTQPTTQPTTQSAVEADTRRALYAADTGAEAGGGAAAAGGAASGGSAAAAPPSGAALLSVQAAAKYAAKLAARDGRGVTR